MPDPLAPFHDTLIDGLEFCRMAYARFEEVASLPDGGVTLRTRQRPEKKLIEEILPICRYIQTFYGLGCYISVRWMDGEQSYDAKIEITGGLVEHGMWPSHGTLEVTQAVHRNEWLMRELLNTKGGGFGLDGITLIKGKKGIRDIESIATSYTNRSYISDMCEIILAAIAKKAEKLKSGIYPADTTLIVDCVLTTVFMRDEWEELVLKVRAGTDRQGFVCIFLTAASGAYSATI